MHTDAALPDEPRSIEHELRALHSAPPADQDLVEEGDEDAPPARAREGLPKSYRSRHDRHYVEQLTSATGMPLLRMLAVGRIDASNLPAASEVMALTASVARFGVLQPLLVRAQGDRFVLIAGRKRLVAAREAQLREVPCLVHTADDARAEALAAAANAVVGERRERLSQPGAAAAPRAECDALTEVMLPEVHHALSTVQRTLRLLPQSPSTTRERVAMKLVAAELERAQWLVRCRRHLAGRVPFTPRAVAASELMKEFRAAAAGIALHGGTLEVADSTDHTLFAVDASLVATAVHGLAWALVALGETAGDPRARVTLAPGSTGGTLALTLTQPTAVLTHQTLLRFFDAGWRTRPGGAAAEIAVQLARYAAARHGAELEVASGAATGTSITFTFR